MSDMKVKVEGHPRQSLHVDLLCVCGTITDGIGLELGDDDGFDGGWVISFVDLERIYKRALAARQ